MWFGGLFAERVEALQQNDPGVLAGVDGFIVPGGDLDLADVGLAQQENGQTGLADAAEITAMRK